MNILYICTYYHRAKIFSDSMKVLNKLGHNVRAFNAVVKGAKIDAKYHDIMDENVNHQESFNKRDRFTYLRKQKKILNRLIETENISDYNLIHSHMLFNGGYVSNKIKKRYGIPYIVSVRNTDLNVFLRIPFMKYLGRKIVNDANGIVFISEAYKTEFIEKYVSPKRKKEISEKSTVIYNGLEDFWLENKNSPGALKNNREINILCVGKIDKNKNIITTIKALNLLEKQGYIVQFTVVGKVLNRKVLEAIKQSSFTKLIDFLSSEELLEVYRNNDIYVMPSIHESFGRVYAEAMTQGLPVVYTKNQGFDKIYEDGYIGYPVEAMEEKQVATVIEKIIINYPRMSEQCIKSSDDFNWNKIGKITNDFYQKSLKGEH